MPATMEHNSKTIMIYKFLIHTIIPKVSIKFMCHHIDHENMQTLL
jgi:sRNA-binding regulator protein Hfq